MSKANAGACPRRARKRMGTRIVRIWRITQRWSYAFLLSCPPLHDLPGTVPNLRRRVAADIFRQGGLRNSWDSPLQCHPALPVSFPPLPCHSRPSSVIPAEAGIQQEHEKDLAADALGRCPRRRSGDTKEKQIQGGIRVYLRFHIGHGVPCPYGLSGSAA